MNSYTTKEEPFTQRPLDDPPVYIHSDGVLTFDTTAMKDGYTYMVDFGDFRIKAWMKISETEHTFEWVELCGETNPY